MDATVENSIAKPRKHSRQVTFDAAQSVLGLVTSRLLSIVLLLLTLVVSGSAQTTTQFDEESPQANAATANVAVEPVEEISAQPLRASGNVIYRWKVGEAQASLLEGDCVLEHAGRRLNAESILLLVSGSVGRVRTEVVVDRLGNSASRAGRADSFQTMTLMTLADPEVQAPHYRGAPEQPPQLLRYLLRIQSTGSQSRSLQSDLATGMIAQTQHQENFQPSRTFEPQVLEDPPMWSEPVPTPPAPEPFTANALPNTVFAEPVAPFTDPPPTTLSDGATTGGFQFFVGGGTRSVEVLARGASMPPRIESIDRPESGETVIVARGGVTVLVRDVSAQMPGGEIMQLGTISLSADRIVGWIPLMTNLFSGSATMGQSEGELYLEGDIVVRQGERIIYADAMYYNVHREIGMVLDAETITTIPEYQGIVRLKADVLQQVSRGNFIAFDAAVTSSRMGVPRYWLQSEQLQLSDRNTIAADPVTGASELQRDPFVSSQDNFVYVGGVPILYWPRFATSLSEPSFYVSDLTLRSDSIFGTQAMIDFNLLQLFGVQDAAKGVDWRLTTGYFSDRGPALGTMLSYQLPGLFGVPGPVNGVLDAWGIDDDGTDTLGRNRRDLPPEESTRGRILFQHRQRMPNDYEFIAEGGLISDRNFLEQYFESEWDQRKDFETGLRLRKYYYSNLFELSANAQVNDFFMETERLPALDHYLIGGSLMANWLTWSAHNHVSYTQLNAADLATNPAEAATITTLPGEQNAQGVIARTRQELAMPLQAGPVKVVPYLSGEAARFGEAANGDSLTRLLGQGGVRASLPMSRVDPTIQSSLLNIRGLAHKLQWNLDYFYADSDTNFDELPLYDSLDDHAQQQFRRRFIVSDYGGVLPDQFDPRTYALRHGMQNNVVSGSGVIADDLQQMRLGLDQRWQTKRGLPGRERIVDLFQLNTDVLIFPDADRDNFGETIGPATYNMSYHIGDRVSLLSDGYFDFFDLGLRSMSAGVRSSRPGVGDIYVGLLSLEGPISSTVFRSTTDYRLNEKWILSSGFVYDFGAAGSVGQSFGITRIGESMLLRIGVNVDHGRDNVGFGFTIEPRFWPSPRLARLGGQLIPPPGVEGLE